MRTGMDRVTLMDSVKYPSVGKSGGGAHATSGKTSQGMKHPYMRKGFVFKCCNKHNPQ